MREYSESILLVMSLGLTLRDPLEHGPDHGNGTPAAGRPRAWATVHRAAVLSVMLATAVCVWLACSYQDDFHVYMTGAHGLFSGALYSQSTRGDLFTYPPFAALVFVPLAWLPSTTAAQVVWALLNEAALLALLTIVIGSVRPDLPNRSRRLWALGLATPALFLDPVLLAVRHGQVDILITVLVLWDLAGTRRLAAVTVPQGVATGLAVAIKLTPLIFVPYLLLTRRGKAAWRCLGTFAVAEAVAFAVSPGTSAAYWTRDLFDYKRVGGSLGLQGLFAPTNQSLLATLDRLSHGSVSPELQWTLAGVLGVLGVALAGYVHFHWSPFLGVALCATTGLLISPVTWTHHMIWVLPVAVWLGAAPDRPNWGRWAAAFTTVLFWASPIWWVADAGSGPLQENGWQFIAGNSFFLWMVLLLATCAAAALPGVRLVIRGRGDQVDPSAHRYFLREYFKSILSVMTVPLTLLGLLERGPSHGYDLKRDYDAYFARGKQLRYSQVYATLNRLARDGKAVAGPVEQGAGPERHLYVITEEGVADVERWLAQPVPPEPDLQSELFAKVVLALLLDRPVGRYLDAQRAAHLQRMRELTDLKHDADQIGVLLADHALYRLEADLRWIDHTVARLDLLARAVQ
jgi:DNA-binding PadR family transcriptional regulator